jgi:anti-sigma-K factor RskA
MHRATKATVWWREVAMSSTVSCRIDSNLALAAEREARLQNRSKNKQLEFWAKIGKALAPTVSLADVLAVSQGIKTLKLELAPSVQSHPVTSDEVFTALEKEREQGVLSDKVTSAQIYYEASIEHPGYLDQVNSVTGQRLTGTFEHGEFTEI